MLNAQRAMVATFDRKPIITITENTNKTELELPIQSPIHLAPHPTPTNAFLGAGGGALVGKLILGGWGAVFGAIAGTAIALYISQRSQPIQSQPINRNLLEDSVSKPKVEIKDTPVDTPALLSVIGQICDSLDNLIATFRAQIQRVVTKYESQEKPTIERDFRTLLEGIQSLIGYKRGHSPEEEKYVAKLQTRVEDLAELLDNYDLAAVDYTPEHSDWFEAVESKNATEVKLVTPAVVKDNNVILKGKIFIPKS